MVDWCSLPARSRSLVRAEASQASVVDPSALAFFFARFFFGTEAGSVVAAIRKMPSTAGWTDAEPVDVIHE